jgi:peptidoglycan/xylan/chitin deacetylase (PgdA/CDA1 family)
VTLTIVMYHYVRDGARVHARTTRELEAQLDFVAADHTVVGLDAVRSRSWPENACLLTFDDGLVEHLDVVAPALARRGLTGVFCAAGAAVLERRVLDVQKSQFVLAASPDHDVLARRIFELVPDEDESALRERWTLPHRYDRPQTVLVKRLLQDGLPEAVRGRVLDALFAELVSDDERAFADGLYLDVDGLRELTALGMELGGHGWEHKRLALLDEDGQRAEIDGSVRLLEAVLGARPREWAMCFAYGSRDETSLRLLRERGCAVGLTTDARIATREDDVLQLPRLDTNDLEVQIVEGARVDSPRAEAP